MILANKLLDSQLFQGIINVISDFQGALLAIEGLVAVVLIIWQCIRMQAATSSFDDGSSGTPTKKYTDNIKKIILIGIVIMASTYMVPTIYSYFNKSDGSATAAYIMTFFLK